MKSFVFALLALFFVSNILAQTFFATTSFDHNGIEKGFPVAENAWAAYKYIDIYVPVSGLPSPLTAGSLELTQINLEYGDASQSFYISTSTDIYLKSPAGVVFNKIVDGNGNGTGINYKHINFRLRDHQTLNVPLNNYSNTNMEPYNVGYYRTLNANEFDNYLGENPNGTWIIEFKNASLRTRPRITKVELVFGVKNEEDITLISSNNSCASPQEFCNDKAFIYYNDGFTNNPSEDPGVLFGGCQWNNGLDNIGWFAWTASETSAKIEISGIDQGKTQQVIVVGNTTGTMSCDVNDLYLVAGGCPKDGVNQISAIYSNGTDENIDLNVSGLTIGETYFLVVDGEGGNISESYLTMSFGAGSCNTLPIVLQDFNGENFNDKNLLYWITASEINNDYFTIERSENTITWQVIDFVNGAGNSNHVLNYKYEDNDIESGKTYYYRLKQTDFDGKYTYSNIISIKTNNNFCGGNLLIYPNPTKNGIVKINCSKNVNIDIYNIDGTLLNNQFEIKKFNLINLGKGIYFVKIYNDTFSKVEKVIFN